LLHSSNLPATTDRSGDGALRRRPGGRSLSAGRGSWTRRGGWR
jgi:hypothetical protein